MYRRKLSLNFYVDLMIFYTNNISYIKTCYFDFLSSAPVTWTSIPVLALIPYPFSSNPPGCKLHALLPIQFDSWVGHCMIHQMSLLLDPNQRIHSLLQHPQCFPPHKHLHILESQRPIPPLQEHLLLHP